MNVEKIWDEWNLGKKNVVKKEFWAKGFLSKIFLVPKRGKHE